MLDHDDADHERDVRLAHLRRQIENMIGDPDLRLAALSQCCAQASVLHDGRIDQDPDLLEDAMRAAVLELETFGFVTHWSLAT